MIQNMQETFENGALVFKYLICKIGSPCLYTWGNILNVVFSPAVEKERKLDLTEAEDKKAAAINCI